MTQTIDHLKILEEEIRIREAAIKLRENLPHLYGMKLYQWQRDFFDTTKKIVVLTANNQSGKSSINIKKAIHWATDRSLWPKLWKKTPTQFWYLYPDAGTATSEFETKWKVEFLPQGELKNHPVYGWKEVKKGGEISHIIFNTGVVIYFKTYGQNVMNLQAGSCYAIFADEEMPWILISELQMRVAATDGYMHFVFTATRGQEEWRRIVEERGKFEMWKESEIDILKIQVSAYDCLTYEDGTPSTVWSLEKIEQTKKFLHSEAQIQRRIYGKFVKDDGLKYPNFNRKIHFIPKREIDLSKGYVFAGIDYGSGTNHQSAICFVWVNRTYTYGVVFKCWVGTKGVPTTSADVIAKYIEMAKGIKVTQAFYDWATADLKTTAERAGLYLEKADKDHATGERVINSLFKLNMLHIMDVEDADTLCLQLESLSIDTVKKDAWDDLADGLRYTVTKIPWDYVDLKDKAPNLPEAPTRPSRFQHHQETKEEDEYETLVEEWSEHFEFEEAYDY